MKNICTLRRSPLVLPFVFGISLLIQGCNSGNSPPKTLPSVVAVSVAVPQGKGFPDAWEAILSEWTARTGVAHSLIEFDPTSAPSEPLSADLNVIPLENAFVFALRNELNSIPAQAVGEDALNWQSIFQGLRERECTLSGEKTLIPVSSPTLVLYYRSDLLSKANRLPPETWNDYLKLLQELPEWAPDLKAVEPWKEEWGATMLLARAAPYAKHPDHAAFLFDLDSGDPMIDSPGFQRAWDENREIVKLLSPAIRSLTPYDCRREILEGRAALAIALESPAFMRATDSDLDSLMNTARAAGIEIGFSQLPGTTESFNPTLRNWEAPRESPVHHVNLTGFDGLCAVVSGKLSNEGSLLAWNLFQTVALDEDSILPPGIASPVRETDLNRPESFTGSSLEPIERGEYLATVGRILRNRQLVLEMPVFGRQKFLSALSETVQEGLVQPEFSGTHFTKSVSSKWNAIRDSLGTDKVRDSYRISLGLRSSAPKHLEPLK